MNFNLSPRCIWLTRHGESLDNKLGKIGKKSTILEGKFNENRWRKKHDS